MIYPPTNQKLPIHELRNVGGMGLILAFSL